MLRSASRAFVLLLLAVSLAGCAWLGRGKARRLAEERARAAARPLAVGRVALVNTEERFALIEANLAQAPASGTTLRVYSGGTVSAELRATGVRRRPFLVADLVNGMPTKGDMIFQPPAVEATPTPAATPTAAEPAPRKPPFWKRWLPFSSRRD